MKINVMTRRTKLRPPHSGVPTNMTSEEIVPNLGQMPLYFPFQRRNLIRDSGHS